MVRKTAKKTQKLTVLISSSVYGKEPLLEQVASVLNGLGYEPWNSHLGTLPVILNASTYESCIKAVEACDIFFGLITPRYGSGTDGAGGPAITHLELNKAIELDKPRLMLAHEQVVHARRLLMDLGFSGTAGRKDLKLKKGAEIIDDLRLIDMYETATREELPIPARRGNWVQKYKSEQDVHRYLETQFGRYTEMQRFVEQLKSEKAAAK